MKIFFVLLLIAAVQLTIDAYPVEEQPKEDDYLVKYKIPEDVKVEEIYDLLRRIVEIIFNEPSSVIDAPVVCPPGYKSADGHCRPVHFLQKF